MTDVVELRGVSKSYGGVRAVEDMDLRVREGEFLTLLGPSGCGKTTTLRLIGGFESPNKGRLYIGGEDVTDVPPYHRPVNTVFQSYALFPHLTVFENVAFALRIRKEAEPQVRQRVLEQLDAVGLGPMEKRKPYQLSGGEQQRVAVARCLISQPRVLLLDEPLGSLDLKLRQHMEVQLKQLQRRVQITFIYVTHDQEEALAMSDRIAVMSAGKVEQIGTPTEVYERPRSRFVAAFLGDANFFMGKAVRKRNGVAHVEVESLGELLCQADRLPASPNAHMSLAVRPEHVTCSKEEPPRLGNLIRGRVDEVLMAGSLDRKVLVTLTNGQKVQILVRAGGFETLAPGDEVFLSWPENRTIVLED